MKLFWALILCLVHLCVVNSFNKYSEEANAPFNDDFLTLEKPFRMNKVNLVWTKAKQVCFVIFIILGLFFTSTMHGLHTLIQISKNMG